MLFLVKGFIIGLSIAAPVGPIGVLTIRRTLNYGRAAGLATGMGAAVADAFYGAVAAFGLTGISFWLLHYSFFLGIVGGAFMIYLGAKFFLSKPPAEKDGPNYKSLADCFTTTLFLTIVNPATILSFLAIFAGAGLVNNGTDFAASSWMVIGVLTGSACWWIILSNVVNHFRNKITPDFMLIINKASGLLIAAFGIWSIYTSTF